MLKLSASGLLLVCGLNLFLGSAAVDIFSLWNSDIFWQLRLPRTLTAASAGALLAFCGRLTQTLFRNHLATPYTLGVSSAASLGAMIALTFGLSWSFVSLSAVAAAALVVCMLYLAYRKRLYSPVSILLLGIALNLFCASAISILQMLGGKLNLANYLTWIMGSVSVVGFEPLLHFILPGLLVVMVGLAKTRELSLMAIEGNQIVTRGFDARKLFFTLLALIAMAIALLVSQLGPIGFIGLVVPHICGRVFPADEKTQQWGNLILGALVLVLADVVNRTLLSGLGLPIGVVTTFFGAPGLAWIVWRQSKF